MCPACLTTAVLAVAGAASAGGLTALTAKALRNRAGREVPGDCQQPGRTR